MSESQPSQTPLPQNPFIIPLMRYGTSIRPVGDRIRLLKLVVYRFLGVRASFRYSALSTALAMSAKDLAVHSEIFKKKA